MVLNYYELILRFPPEGAERLTFYLIYKGLRAYVKLITILGNNSGTSFLK